LTDVGLIEREKRGRMYFYYAALDDLFIKQLKIAQNLVCIRPLIAKLKEASLRIVLYGSSATGTNNAESDINLFVLSREPKVVKDIIYRSPFKQRVQCVVSTLQDFVRLKKGNPVFYKEISGGIVLLENK
jgi:predicted nucleotidyltransferase